VKCKEAGCHSGDSMVKMLM